MSARIDIEGRKFGKLLVLSFDSAKYTHAIWNVECECGKKLKVSYSNLITGNSKGCASCGQKTHGLAGTSFYSRWIVMKAYHKDFIAKEWLEFANFRDDIYDTYKREYSLRRLDKTKQYSKENCYWSIPNDRKNIKNERILFV